MRIIVTWQMIATPVQLSRPIRTLASFKILKQFIFPTNRLGSSRIIVTSNSSLLLDVVGVFIVGILGLRW